MLPPILHVDRDKKVAQEHRMLLALLRGDRTPRRTDLTRALELDPGHLARQLFRALAACRLRCIGSERAERGQHGVRDVLLRG